MHLERRMLSKMRLPPVNADFDCLCCLRSKAVFKKTQHLDNTCKDISTKHVDNLAMDLLVPSSNALGINGIKAAIVVIDYYSKMT